MSIYSISVPVFLQMLNSLSAVLDKASDYAASKTITPEVLLEQRLFPDMLPLTRQVQIACDFAGKTCARLAGMEPQSIADTEKTLEDVKGRIAKTVTYISSFRPDQFRDAETRDITFPAGLGKTMTLKGEQYLAHVAMPNFYFHVVTAYDILRHNGVVLGKRDFLGTA